MGSRAGIFRNLVLGVRRSEHAGGTADPARTVAPGKDACHGWNSNICSGIKYMVK